MEIFILIWLVALIALNAYASRQCYRNTFSSRGQRLAQLAFIWGVPFFGATLALRLLQNEPEKSLGTYRNEPNMGEEFVASGRLNAQGYFTAIGENAHSVGESDASPH